MAAVLRTAAFPVGVGDGSGLEETVPFEVPVGLEAAVVVLFVAGGTTTTTAVVVVGTTTATEEVVVAKVVVATAVVVVAASLELELAAALVVAPATGMLKVTPALLQRAAAAVRVFWKSGLLAPPQACVTHGIKPEINAELLQIHLMSVSWHPVEPKLLIAQERAHCGMEES